MYRIMLVDDEENILNALRRVLSSNPGEWDDTLLVETFTEPEEALRRARHTAFDLVMSDYRMPRMNGVEFLKEFKRMQPNVGRLILSGYADLDGLIGAINEVQIFRFLAKPWHDYEIKSAIAQALAYRDMLLENQCLADVVRMQQGRLSRQELELKRLEDENPGITQVNWGPDGSVIIDDTDP